MTLSELREKLEAVNDYLVDAENEFTWAGDMPEFTILHTDLDHMLDVVVELINDWSVTG